jgi:hypothetical protein
MKSSSFQKWFSENCQLVEDIESVYTNGGSIHIFDYELRLGSVKQSVNYTIMQLARIESAATSLTSTTAAHVEKVLNGVVLVIEQISFEKRILSTLGR